MVYVRTIGEACFLVSLIGGATWVVQLRTKKSQCFRHAVLYDSLRYSFNAATVPTESAPQITKPALKDGDKNCWEEQTHFMPTPPRWYTHETRLCVNSSYSQMCLLLHIPAAIIHVFFFIVTATQVALSICKLTPSNHLSRSNATSAWNHPVRRNVTLVSSM